VVRRSAASSTGWRARRIRPHLSLGEIKRFFGARAAAELGALWNSSVLSPLPELIENASVTVAYSRLSGAIFERCRTQATKDNWSLASNNRGSPQLIRLRRGPNRVSDKFTVRERRQHHEVTSWLILHQWPQLSAVR
jgi:hypothetical protein